MTLSVSIAMTIVAVGYWIVEGRPKRDTLCRQLASSM